MSLSLNKVTLIGNLGKDPEIRYSTFGLKIVNLTIATSDRWKDKNTKEYKEKTEWHRVVIFNENLADLCEKYLKSGSKVYIEGSLQNRKWTDQSGVDRYTTEIVIQRFKGEIIILSENNRSKEDLEKDDMHKNNISDQSIENTNSMDIEKKFLNKEDSPFKDDIPF